MSRLDPKTPRRASPDQDPAWGIAPDAEVKAEVDADAVARILTMLTSRRVDPDDLFAADGARLSTMAFERRAMWF